MRLIRFTALAFGVLGIAGCATSRGAQPAVEHRHYANPVHHWYVSYPQDWVLDSRDAGFVKIRSPLTLRGRRGLVGIHSGTFGPEWLEVNSLDYFADKWLIAWGVEITRNGLRWETLSRRTMALADGTPALEIINLLGTGVVGKSRKIFVLVQPRGFLLDAEASVDSWPELEPQFDQIINSFTIQP